MSKAFNAEGEEIEVYTAEEYQAGINTEVEKVKGEFTPKLTALETELGTAKTALGDRAHEFGQFRELHKDVVDKLSVAERALYENQLAQKKDADARVESEKKTREATIDSVIKAKSAGNEKLAAKMKDMWSVIGIETPTQEAMEQKANMILGALGTTEPDLIASVGSFSGGAFVPETKKEGEKTFADTPQGQALGNELGLTLEAKK